MLTNTATRYGSVARTFHWTIAVLILINIVLALDAATVARSSLCKANEMFC